MDMHQKREDRKNKPEEENSAKTNINWYPGHMAKTKRLIKEDISLIDVVVEILDARIPISSQNPDIAELTKNKKRVVLLNKSDLSDKQENAKWIKHFEQQVIPTIATNANNGDGIKSLIRTIEILMEDEMERQAARGRIGKTIKVMILGIPNVGKSSLINKITNKKSAQVGNKPGVTRQKQWIKLSNKIDLLDTPGVLWPKFESQEIALNLSFIGTIKDENLQITEIAYYLIKKLEQDYLSNILNRYKIEESEYLELINKAEGDNVDKTYALIELIARKRGALLPGNNPDIEKISNIILDEFRSTKLGNITLEKIDK